MKKLLFSIFLLQFCVLALFAQRTGIMNIAGVPCEYDTMVHRPIAPGATYTQYQFNNLKYGESNISYKMRAHVITVDLTNPYNSLRPHMEDYFKARNQVQFVRNERAAGRKAVASIAGIDFEQVSNSNNSRKSNELRDIIMVNNDVRYARSDFHSHLYLFNHSFANVGNIRMKALLSTSLGDIAITSVNHCREIGEVVLFCNGMTSWSINNNDGMDFVLTVSSNGGRIMQGINECTLKEATVGCSHSTSTGECIISVSGEIAENFRSLEIGDTISINIQFEDDKETIIEPDNICNIFNDKSIANGEVVLFNRKMTAYPCYGVSEDGKTVYLADIEISQYSNAPADCLSYLLKEIGVYTANWADGGPSAEMTVDGDWVTINSIGGGFNGRYIPGCMMLYSTAPDDPVITSIELKDPTAKTMVAGQSMGINIYGYNQYGEMIDASAQLSQYVTMEVDNNLGYIQNGTFYAEKEGSGFIHVRVTGQTDEKKIPITVKSERKLIVSPQKLFTGEGRSCQLSLFVEENGETYEIPPYQAEWRNSNKNVVLSCKNGLIVPYMDGFSEIIVEYQDLSASSGVTVENLEELVDYLDLTDKIDANKGIIDYRLPSVPHYFEMRIQGEPEAVATLYYQIGYGETQTASETIAEDGTAIIQVILDYDDPVTYPVSLNTITAGSSSVKITNLTAYYVSYDCIEECKSVDNNTLYFSILGQPEQNPNNGFFINKGKKTVIAK